MGEIIDNLKQRNTYLLRAKTRTDLVYVQFTIDCCFGHRREIGRSKGNVKARTRDPQYSFGCYSHEVSIVNPRCKTIFPGSDDREIANIVYTVHVRCVSSLGGDAMFLRRHSVWLVSSVSCFRQTIGSYCNHEVAPIPQVSDGTPHTFLWKKHSTLSVSIFFGDHCRDRLLLQNPDRPRRFFYG